MLFRKTIIKISGAIKVFRTISVSSENRQQKLERKDATCTTKPISDHILQKFAAYYPSFINCVVDDHAFKDMCPSDKLQLKEMLDYNLPHGYRRIPFFLLSAHHAIVDLDNISEHKLDQVHLMGWCLHMMQTAFQILDDIADHTEIRSDRQCWHLTQGIGLDGIMDGLLLSALIPNLLKRHFSKQKHYHDMLELINLVILMSSVGERIQLSRCHWNDMTLDRWKRISYNKTAWYQCVMPFKTALFPTETFDEKKFKIMEPILLDFGILLQLINDLLDTFPMDGQPVGNPTDIKDGKCSWLLVNALQLSTPSQRRHIEENYGKKDDASVAKVTDIYKELGLKEYGEAHKEQLFWNIIDRIDNLPPNFPKQALRNGLLVGYLGY